MFKRTTLFFSWLNVWAWNLGVAWAEGPGDAVKKAEQAVDKAGDGLRNEFPPSWLTPSLFGLQRWQWVAIPVLVVLVVLAALMMVQGTQALLRRFGKGQVLIERLARPLQLAWGALFARIALPFLGFSKRADTTGHHVFRVVLGFAIFWGLWRAVRAWSDSVATNAFVQARPGNRALVNLFSRITRFALMAIGALWVLAEVGYSVGSVLAGLGIGGIALALGAQKTLENVFGAFALAVDQPIREGDLVRVEDFMGTVESIGLRSTRIRSIDRTLISIPNGKLADMRLETFAVRDRLRLLTTVGLRHDTTASQIGQVIQGFREALAQETLLCPDSASVHLIKLGESSQDIEIMAWFATTDDETFRRIRESVLLHFLTVVEKAGTTIASPTRTIHVLGNGGEHLQNKPEELS